MNRHNAPFCHVDQRIIPAINSFMEVIWVCRPQYEPILTLVLSFLPNCSFAEDIHKASWYERHFPRVWRRHAILQRAMSAGYNHPIHVIWNYLLLHCYDVEDHRSRCLFRFPLFIALSVPLWIRHYSSSSLLCSSLCTTLFAIIPCMLAKLMLTPRDPCQKDKSAGASWSCPSWSLL